MTRIGSHVLSSLAGLWLAASTSSDAAAAGAPGFFGSLDGSLPAEVRLALRERLKAVDDLGGDGGGGSVANLLVVQIAYRDEDPRQEFWLTWALTGPNRSGLQVFANGFPVVYDGTGIPVVLPPETTEIFVFADGDAGIGTINWEVVGEPPSATDAIVGVASQPFGDPNPLTCYEGTRDPTAGTCSLILDIKSSRQPEFYYVTLDGGRLPQTIPGVPIYTLKDVPPGPHDVTLLGAISEAGNDYLGDPVSTSCSIECRDLPCDRPFDLSWCQNAFGPAGADNKVLLQWRNGELSYKEIRVSVDGGEPKVLPGDATETILEGVEPGDRTAAIEGDCGDQGKSEPASIPLTVLDGPPHGDPLKDFTCRFPTPSAAVLNGTWKNLTQAGYIEVYILGLADDLRLAKTLPGEAVSVSINGTIATDRLALRFYYEGATCYSSQLQVCVPTPPPGWKYLLGDCDSNSNVDITDAIFSLGHLFRGGQPSRCAPACNVNLDSGFNLADPIYLLSHLFRGGPPPAGSYPECDTTVPSEETCGEDTCNR